MTALNLLAAYGGVIVALLLVMYFINRSIRKYLTLRPHASAELSTRVELI